MCPLTVMSGSRKFAWEHHTISEGSMVPERHLKRALERLFASAVARLEYGQPRYSRAPAATALPVSPPGEMGGASQYPVANFSIHVPIETNKALDDNACSAAHRGSNAVSVRGVL